MTRPDGYQHPYGDRVELPTMTRPGGYQPPYGNRVGLHALVNPIMTRPDGYHHPYGDRVELPIMTRPDGHQHPYGDRVGLHALVNPTMIRPDGHQHPYGDRVELPTMTRPDGYHHPYGDRVELPALVHPDRLVYLSLVSYANSTKSEMLPTFFFLYIKKMFIIIIGCIILMILIAIILRRRHRVLVLYVFHQENDRVRQFLRDAVFQDDNVDFIVIANDENFSPDRVPGNVILIRRPNDGYDFGGWSHALEMLQKDDRLDDYDYFVFVNSSVSGPYISDPRIKRWTDLYTDGLKNNVRLFGSTINMTVRPHIQSYVFAMDREALYYLMNVGIFSTKHETKTFQDTIYYKEVEMSSKILERGWNIGSRLLLYKDIDFTNMQYDGSVIGDVMFPQYEQEGVWTRDELIFIKGNRFGY